MYAKNDGQQIHVNCTPEMNYYLSSLYGERNLFNDNLVKTSWRHKTEQGNILQGYAKVKLLTPGDHIFCLKTLVGGQLA